MSLEPRTVTMSKSNFDAAIETFLRQIKEIKDNEDVTLEYVNYTADDYKVMIIPKEVENTIH